MIYPVLGGARQIGWVLGSSKYTPSAATEWWNISGKTCIQALDAIGASSLANSYVDLSGTGNDASVVSGQNAPDWANGTGWTYNGTNMCLTTGIIPTDTMTTTVRFSGVSSDTTNSSGNETLLFGAQDGSYQRWWMAPNWRGVLLCAYKEEIAGNGAGSRVTSGVLTMVAVSASQLDIYYNGSFVYSQTGATGVACTVAMFLGVRNNNGSPAYENTDYSGYIIEASAIHSDQLTAGEIATLHTSILTLT